MTKSRAPASDRPSLPLRLGCGPLFFSLLVACVLLTINGIAVASLYQAWTPRLAEFWKNARVAQAVLFLGPLAMLVLQWLALDVLVDWLRPLPRQTEEAERDA